MEKILIRKIREEDNEALKTIIRSVFEEHDAPREGTVYSDPTTNDLYKLFRKDRSVLWVAEESREVLGCCGVYPTEGLDEDCAELVKFYLLSQVRGKGLGRTLMLKSIQSAKEMEYKKLYLESAQAFSKAVTIYEKLGFTKLKKPLGKSGHVSCNIWMLMELE